MKRCIENAQSHRAASIGRALCCLVSLISTGAVHGLVDPWRHVVALPLLVAAFGFSTHASRLRWADQAPLSVGRA